MPGYFKAETSALVLIDYQVGSMAARFAEGVRRSHKACGHCELLGRSKIQCTLNVRRLRHRNSKSVGHSLKRKHS